MKSLTRGASRFNSWLENQLLKWFNARLFMKTLQTILALIALFALMPPCVHVEAHHHHEPSAAELCSMDHAECHTCSDEPCSDRPEVGSIVSVAEIPVPQLQLLCELKPEHFSFVAVAPPSGELLHLQTVQLLI